MHEFIEFYTDSISKISDIWVSSDFEFGTDFGDSMMELSGDSLIKLKSLITNIDEVPQSKLFDFSTTLRTISVELNKALKSIIDRPIENKENLIKQINGLLSQVSEHQVNANTVMKIAGTAKKNFGQDIKFNYSLATGLHKGESTYGWYYAKTATPEGNQFRGTITITRTAFKAGDVADTVIHELTHSIDEKLRLANLTERGKKELSNYKSIYDLPVSEVTYNKEFISNYLLPASVSRFEIQQQLTKGLSSVQIDDPVITERLAYQLAIEEIIARAGAAARTGGMLESSSLKEVVELLSKSISTDLSDFIDWIAKNALQIDPLKRGQAIEQAMSSSSKNIYVFPTLFKGEGGGGMNEQFKAKIKELLQQRIGAAFEQLNPEQMQRLLDAAIEGERVRFGQGRRISTEKIRQSAEKYIQDILKQAGQAAAQGAEQGLPKAGSIPDSEAARIAQQAIQNQQKNPPREKDFMPGVAKSLGTQGYLDVNEINASGQAIEREIDRLRGLDVELQSVSVKSKELSENTVGVSASFRTTEGDISKLTQYVVRAGDAFDVLSQKEFKAQQQQKTPYTPKELQGYQAQFPKAFEKAQTLGFEPGNLSKVVKEASTEISRLSFVAKNADGVMSTLNLTVDRFGRTLVDNQRRFRGFGESILRNTTEVLRWSIAVSLIYGPMYKLQELVSTAIDNQSKLADITIAVGQAQRDTNDIFYDAADAAQAAGESINGVLAGYADAYRAAGGVTDATERTVVANKLLVDSLTLSKLSALDQKEALDVLSGSLRQVQTQLVGTAGTVSQALQSGATLLDKWVAVSNRANVDLAAMATAFSITSESAENAGVSIDQLNGIIGSLSEKIGGLGGRETGNAVRALIGGVYTDAAAKALQQYGIAVTDTTGQMRDFLDIMQEIYQLNQKGLISDTQLNKLALTLGGGVRRGQQYLAFITDLQRVNEIAAVSAGAHGDAQEALSIKLETVQSSITRLGNAFQKLAQTLGTKGGILDTIKGITDLATTLIGVVDKLVGSLGKAGPVLATAALAYATLFRGKPGAFTGGVNDAITGVLGGKGQSQTYYYGQTPINIRQQSRGERFAGSFGGDVLNAGITGSLIGLPSAISYANQGGAEGLTKAGVTIGSSIVGTLLAGGNPIGGVIGNAISQYFIGGLEASKGKIEDIFKPVVEETPTTKTGVGGVTTSEEAARARLEDIARRFYGAGTTGGQAKTFGLNLVEQVGGALGMGTTRGNELTSYQQARYEAEKIIAISQGKEKGSPFYKVTEEDVKRAKELLAAYKEAEKNVPIEGGQLDLKGSRIQGTITGYGQQYKPQIDQISKDFMNQLRSELGKGNITARQFTEQGKTTTGFEAALPKYFTAMYSESERAAMSEDDVIKKFRELANVITKGSDEQLQYYSQLNDEIVNLEGNLEKVAETGQKVKIGDVELDKNQIQAKIDELRNLYKTGFTQLQRDIAAQQIKLPSTVDLSGYNQKQFTGTIVPAAQKAYQEYLNALTPEERDVKLAEDAKIQLLVKLSDMYTRLGEIPADFLTGVIDDLKKQAKLPDVGGIGFQTFNVSNAVLQQVAMQSIAMAQQWQSAYGYQPDIQDQITIDKNGIIDPMKADWKIVQYLLSQIADNTEKTVDGIFNLPENASFWFPSGLLPYLQGGGGGGGGGVPSVKGGGATTEQYYQQQEQQRMKEISDRDKRLQAAEERDRTPASTTQRLMTGLDWFYQQMQNQTSVAGGLPAAPKPGIPPTQPGFNYYPYGRGPGVGAAGLAPEFQMPQMLGPNATPVPTPQNVPEPSPISLKLEFESRHTFMVDGRVLAEAMSPYLGEFMLQSDGTQGGAALKVAI